MQDGQVTVVFQKKLTKGGSSVSTRREEREKERQLELNPQVTQSHKRVGVGGRGLS